MTRYEKLIIEVNKNGVEVEEIDFGTNKKCGKCVDNTILINNKLTELEKFEVLLEEYGHYKTTFGNISDLSNIKNSKLEKIARREGYKIFAKPSLLIDAVKSGATDDYEISDYLSVSKEVLKDVIEDLKAQYGIRIPIGDYYLYLEPHLDIALNKDKINKKNNKGDVFNGKEQQ
ncbi:ImmA/IrrE family metallo-endopeptidase [Clostridium sp.]|uniref:ImmA/IrrE family metallo-endopeptidase n=1 Tax=Clostridium sp. TaxID=1506 RepID=UPI0029075B8A|nr:ImmA/IrrE family metallo-endopeptidase [Clostridium sp.]MDU4480235.1 hypothetical protein [Clostridium sp.]